MYTCESCGNRLLDDEQVKCKWCAQRDGEGEWEKGYEGPTTSN